MKKQKSNTTLTKTNDVSLEISEITKIDTDVLQVQIPSNSVLTHKHIQLFKDLYLQATPQNIIAERLGVPESTSSMWYISVNGFMYKFIQSLRLKRLLRVAENSLSTIAENGEEKNKLTASLAIIDKLGGEEWNKKQEEKGEVKINFGFNVQGNVMVAPTTPE